MKLKKYSVLMTVRATLLINEGFYYEKDFITINTSATNKYNAVLTVTRLSSSELKFIRENTVKGINSTDWKNVLSIEIINIDDVTLIKD